MQIKSQLTVWIIILLVAFIISLVFVMPPLTASIEMEQRHHPLFIQPGMDRIIPPYTNFYPRMKEITFDFVLVFLLAGILLFLNTRDITFKSKRINTKWFTFVSIIESVSVCLMFIGLHYWHASSGFRPPSIGFSTFKILSASIFAILTAVILQLIYRQQSIMIENERLRTENIQNRFDALTAQINPHFFFNSLNSLASLIRDNKTKESLHYINELSDIFRYVLKNSRLELVTLREEIEFINAYRYLLEIRYENKLFFYIDIPDVYMKSIMPALSLQPVVENAVKHNVISFDNPLTVSIYVMENKWLVISNPIQKKMEADSSFGFGLENLRNRYQLILAKDIDISFDNQVFTVKLPLM